jgi:hypothetical protein
MNATLRTTLLGVVAAIAAACNRPGELPDMGVSRTTLSFEAPGGTGEPSPQTIWVQNTGRGSLTRPTAGIDYEDGAGWLAATVSGSGVPWSVTVQPTTTGLDPGVYRATMTLACDNASSSPIQVDVTLTVPDPRFTLSISSLALDAPRGGGDPAPRAFQVSNGGRGTLPVPDVGISYVGRTGWLTATVSGTPDAYTVDVSATTVGMDSGVYTATMSIRADAVDGPPRTLGVTLTVPPAEVALSAHEFRIEAPTGLADPAPVELTVTNAGGGFLGVPTATVTYPLYEWAPFLTATVSGTEAPYTVTLQARQLIPPTPWGLTSGTYEALVAISPPDSANTETVAVTFVVHPPVLLVSSDTVSWSALPGCPPQGSRSIVVTNGGGRMLEGLHTSVPDDAITWLDAAVAGWGETYSVTFNVKGVPPTDPVTHAATTTVLLEQWEAEPVAIAVRYSEIATDVSTSVSPSPLAIWAQDGTGDPGPHRISVRTQGACPPPPTVGVSYSSPTDPDWISTEIRAAAQGHDVIVRASADVMSTGDARTATVHLASPWFSADVPVTFTIGAIAPTGAITVARRWPVLTPLPDGRALATGGTDVAGRAVPTTEIYDPATGQWTEIAPMTRPRVGHGAVVLEGGQVLVCGGGADGAPDASCEWLSGTDWSPAASLRVARSAPKLVALPGGKVLVASNDYLPEIIDPSTGQGEVSYASGSSAVKLADGRVLVAGGSTWTLNWAWIYYPDAPLPWGSWGRTGDKPTPHADPALILLSDGRVLAVGGERDGPIHGAVADLWDPRTGIWSTVAAPPSIHAPASIAALSNGKAIAVAGSAASGGVWATVADVELFDPATETWSPAGTLPAIPQSNLAVVRLESGMILMAGGDFASESTLASEAFTW